MARLPYLEDLSIVLNDLQNLVDGPLKDYVLFFDGPEITLNIQSAEASLSTQLALSAALRKSFSEIRFFSRAARDQEGIRKINELATHLVADL